MAIRIAGSVGAAVRAMLVLAAQRLRGPAAVGTACPNARSSAGTAAYLSIQPLGALGRAGCSTAESGGA